MAYRERASMVPGAVVWRQDSSGPGEVLPDGCMDLLWMDDTIMVAGPDTIAHPVHGDGRAYVGIRFRSGTLPALLGVPAVELRDRRVRLADLVGPRVADRVRDRFARSDHPGRVLEEYAADLIAEHDQDRRTPELLAMISSGLPVAEIGRRIGLGERQLHRHGLQYFGYGPAMLRRILRLQRAFALAESGRPAAMIAARAGYSDQAHLIRDCRALTGRSFGERVILAG
ncbi:helix-turn-helix domain-containing protein [Microlunatus sp. Gsoil 973]|uniref:helix-turn-helix domain-containing protein n=1 Tax=Microlunatus sp. Gsoil 973 TaxID=2672569 RepID=UPI0012B44644|nr:helix-turn-helix domain-containing protein [Microlunatus sp. Gsoil 973]QGN33419.1 helix-turn-helix domain-containing protein [Microlunatus sp. Gsoil 973]